MLKCKDIAEKSSDYLDGSLTFGQRLQFKLHLMMCNNCRRFMGQLKNTIKVSSSIDQHNLENQVNSADKILAMVKDQAKNSDTHIK